MLKDLMEVLSMAFIFILLVILIGAVLFAPLNYLSCKNYEAVSGNEVRYMIPGGCYIKDGDKWYTESQYENVLIAKQGLESAR